jgi:hypothetical protein
MTAIMATMRRQLFTPDQRRFHLRDGGAVMPKRAADRRAALSAV